MYITKSQFFAKILFILHMYEVLSAFSPKTRVQDLKTVFYQVTLSKHFAMESHCLLLEQILFLHSGYMKNHGPVTDGEKKIYWSKNVWRVYGCSYRKHLGIHEYSYLQKHLTFILSTFMKFHWPVFKVPEVQNKSVKKLDNSRARK